MVCDYAERTLEKLGCRKLIPKGWPLGEGGVLLLVEFHPSKHLIT